MGCVLLLLLLFYVPLGFSSSSLFIFVVCPLCLSRARVHFSSLFCVSFVFCSCPFFLLRVFCILFFRFLISLSYELSKLDHSKGTPERPISDLGQKAYDSYWQEMIFLFLVQKFTQGITDMALAEISDATFIMEVDIIHTLNKLHVPISASRHITLTQSSLLILQPKNYTTASFIIIIIFFFFFFHNRHRQIVFDDGTLNARIQLPGQVSLCGPSKIHWPALSPFFHSRRANTNSQKASA